MKHQPTILVLLTVLATATLFGCYPPGQRLLTFKIVQNETVILEGRVGVPDGIPVENMWDVLELTTFKPVSKDSEIASADDPKVAKLDDVQIQITHAGKELDRRKLDSLSLTLDDSGSTWSFSKEEAEKVRSSEER